MNQSDHLTPSPAANDDVPWAVRYMPPLAVLAVAVFIGLVGWLLTL